MKRCGNCGAPRMVGGPECLWCGAAFEIVIAPSAQPTRVHAPDASFSFIDLNIQTLRWLDDLDVSLARESLLDVPRSFKRALRTMEINQGEAAKQWEDRHRGTQNAHRPLVLDTGRMKAKTT